MDTGVPFFVYFVFFVHPSLFKIWPYQGWPGIFFPLSGHEADQGWLQSSKLSRTPPKEGRFKTRQPPITIWLLASPPLGMLKCLTTAPWPPLWSPIVCSIMCFIRLNGRNELSWFFPPACDQNMHSSVLRKKRNIRKKSLP